MATGTYNYSAPAAATYSAPSYSGGQTYSAGTSVTTMSFSTGQTPNRYSTYLENEYNNTNAIPKDTQGRTQYDLARERTNIEAERQRSAYQDALRRQMAQRGTLQSGVYDKSARNLDVEMERSRMGELGNINMAELGEISNRQNRLGTQAFQAEQATQAQGLQERLSMADLTLRERNAAEGARQFDNQQSFNVWATQNGFNQQEADRAWNAWQNQESRGLQKELSYADLSLREKTLAEQARQFNTKDAFDRWALGQNLTENEKNRIWQANQNTLEREQKGELFYADLSLREQELAQQSRQFTTELEFKKWATQVGIDDNAANRIWQAGQNELDREQKGELFYADLTQREKEFAQNAYQFTTKLEFDRWATQAGLDDNTANRVWQSVENERTRDANTAMEAQRIQGELTVLNAQDAIATRNRAESSRANRYGSLGLVASQDPAKALSASDLATLQKNDPLSYEAYQSGLMGKTIQDIESDVQLAQSYRAAMITAAMEDPKTLFDIAKMFAAWGVSEARQYTISNTSGNGRGR